MPDAVSFIMKVYYNARNKPALVCYTRTAILIIDEVDQASGHNAFFSGNAVERAIKSLKEKSILIRKGARKNGKWIILNEKQG